MPTNSLPDGLRIAILHPCYWPEVRRGAERVIHGLAMGLVERGHRPHLITSHPGPASTLIEDGLLVTRARRPRENILRRLGYDEYITHLPRTYRTLRRGSYDIVHAFYVTDALAAQRYARRMGAPSLFTITGMPRRDVMEGRPVRLEAWQAAVRGAGIVTSDSKAASDSLSWLGRTPRVLNPGVDQSLFRPLGERACSPTIFCPTAIEDPRKRVDLLLEAFASLRADRPNARLVLVKPPKRSPGADRAAARPGVELRQLGHGEGLVRAFGEAWLTVLPARREAFGLVLIESLACGTPVVGTDEGGIPEIIDRAEVGRLFAADDADALAQALADGLELSQKPGTAAACVKRAGSFSARRALESYLSLYAELLGDSV